MAKTFSKQGGYLKYEDDSIPLIKTYNFNQLEYLISGNNILFPDAMSIAYNDAALTNVFANVEEFSDQLGLWKEESQTGISDTTNPDPVFGAFGEQITAHKTPIIQISNRYQQDPAVVEDIEIFEATGGSADNNENKFRFQTGTSVGGYGVIRSNNTLNYKAGQGVEAQFTASFTTGVALSLQFGGMFSISDTLAFGYDGADFSCLHSYGGLA